MRLFNNRGDIGILNLILTVCFIIFIIIPVFSLIFEKNIILIKSSSVIESVSAAVYSGYEALDTRAISEVDIKFKSEDLISIISKKIGENLGDEEILIEDIKVLNNDDESCGSDIENTTIHMKIRVLHEASMFNNIVTKALGEKYKYYYIHIDREIAINN